MVEGVVEVVEGHGLKAPVSGRVCLEWAALVEHGLALQADADLQSEGRELVELRAEHVAWGDLDELAALVGDVGVDEDGARQVRQDADGVVAGDDGQVAVPVVPAGEVEALQGGHVHVGGQDVGAGLRLGRHPVQEDGGAETLALEPSHHVRDGEHHRGDLSAVHGGAELVGGEKPRPVWRLAGPLDRLVAHHTTSPARAVFSASLPRVGIW
ncbi:hypothetical protein [Streptomyces mirabilis]|uniref:hypothetical protein n=1 Tax=Streptomyces mirabilis TaxID=68239 RepID=UPI0034133BF5